MDRPNVELPARFWRRVQVTPGCWVWLTPRDDGYGRFMLRGVRRRAHQWTYGEVPAGLVLDHLCRNRACVNPAHLRAVTSRENTLAAGSEAIALLHAQRTHCPYGHPYSETNTRITSGRRRCRICLNAARRAKRKAVAA